MESKDVEFYDCIITHNHPIDDDVYRFFEEDDYTFLKNNDKSNVLRVVNPDYTYEIQKLKEFDDISYNEMWLEAMNKVFQDNTLEIQDEAMKILAERGYVQYERRNTKTNG